jgi:hypothetical protein
MGNIVWISSFPRSGNTWFRCFLAGLLQPNLELDLADLPSLHCANRQLIEQSLCFSTGDLTVDEVNKVRPGVYRHWSETWEASSPLFIKTHDCYTSQPQGLPIFPADASRAVVYIIRNPLDVCVSYAKFWGDNDYDTAADYICDPEHSHPLDQNNLFGQLYQHISDWSHHVKSWGSNQDIPTKVVRYEDMKMKPAHVFLDIVQFLELPYGEQEVKSSLAKCDFANLQKRESQSGFKDRPYKGSQFFRQGEINSWRKTLEPHTVNRIVNCHAEEMIKHGYLAKDGTLV